MTKLFTTLITATLSLTAAAALPPDISIEPAPGTTLEQIDVFNVKSGYLEKRYNIDTAEITINGKSYIADLTTPDYETLVFTLRTPVTAAGTYSVIIPENTFLMGWEGDPNSLIEFSYTVENDLGGGGDEPGEDTIQNTVPAGYTFSPTAGTEIEVLSTFSVTAENDMFLTAASRQQQITINGTHVEALTCTSGENGNTLTWKLAEPINTPGHYTIFIPQGSFYGYAETDNETFLVTVIVTGGELPEPDYYAGEITSDPADGATVNELSRLAVMSPKLTSAYIGPEADKIIISDTDGPLDIAYTLTPDEDDFNEAHVIWMDLTPAITAAGEYTISFPARCFEIAKYPDNWYTAPFTLTFTVGDADSITETATDTPAAEYFTLDGMKATPSRQGIYLRRQGNKTDKVIIK